MKDEEHNIQVACVNWFRYVYRECMIFAIPNGGRRDEVTGAKMKAEGVLAGVADLVILAPNRMVFFIEMKTRKGVQSMFQKQFQKLVNGMGFGYFVCRSFDEFKWAVEYELGAR